MKRFVALLLVAVLLILSGCSQGNSSSVPIETTPQAENVKTPEPSPTQAPDPNAEIKIEIADILSDYFTAEDITVSGALGVTTITATSDDVAVSIKAAQDTSTTPDGWDDFKSYLCESYQSLPTLPNAPKIVLYIKDSPDGEIYLTISNGSVAHDIFDLGEVDPAVQRSISAGMYLVGKDIAAGTYRLTSAGGMAYWERASNATGELGSIIANDVFDSTSYVTVNNGEYLTLTGCSGELQ